MRTTKARRESVSASETAETHDANASAERATLRDRFTRGVTRVLEKYFPGPALTYWQYKTIPPVADPAPCESVSYCNAPADHADDDDSHLMDVSLPAFPPPPEGYPAVIIIHGGGFFTGDKSDAYAQIVAKELSAVYGYAVFSINYALIPDTAPGQSLSQAIGDVDLALKAVRADADTYGINPDSIAFFGVSAGGFIALAAAEYAAIDVDKVVAVYAPTDLSAIPGLGGAFIRNRMLSEDGVPYMGYDLAGPLRPFRGEVLIAHGGADTTVPVAHAESLYESRCHGGLPTKLMLLPDEGHGFLNEDGVATRAVLREVDTFLKTPTDEGTTPACPEKTIVPTDGSSAER